MDGSEVRDISWYRPDGEEMTEDEWNAGWVRCLGVRLSGRTLHDVDRYGEPIRDDSFLFCLNPHHEHIDFYLPACASACRWEVVLDTRDASRAEPRSLNSKEPYDICDHSAVLFREAQQMDEKESKHDQKVREEHTLELRHAHAEEKVTR